MANRFTEQISDWLSSAGRDILFSSEGTFQCVHVKKNETLVLVIFFINPHSWHLINAESYNFQYLKSTLDQFRKSDIHAVALWEDIWISNEEIVKSRINALLGTSMRIPGRLTTIKRIDKKTAGEFLKRNHLQGNVFSKTQYGLYLPSQYYRVLNDEFRRKAVGGELLVAVATFSHPRIFRHDNVPFRSYELVRFANHLNVTVVGGLAKLLKAFSADFRPGDIMTYADLEWSDGASYRKLGFKEISDTPPFTFQLDTITGSRTSVSKTPAEVGDQPLISNLGSRKFVKDFHEISDF